MRTSIQFKLIAGFIAVAFIAGIIGIVGFVGIKTIDAADTKLYEKMTLPLTYIIHIDNSFQRIRVNIRDLFRTTDAEKNKYYNDRIDNFQKIIDQNEPLFEATIITDEAKNEFKAYKSAREQFYKYLEEMVKLGMANKNEEGYVLMDGDAKKSADDVVANLEKIIESKQTLAKKTSDDNTSTANLISLIMIFTLSFGIAISLFLGIWLGRFVISRPLNKISDTLGNGAGQIALASNQLSGSSQEIANGATEQASSIEETTSSMEELASMVKQNVQNAKEASTLADKTANTSQSGFVQMEKMLESMNEINKASSQIQKVIKVIDDIAFQTNILALNAAVEAARAGEAGMGFAVVADEVKNLANKSAEAAKETASMIEDSIKKTGGGLDIATKLAEVFKEILTNAQKVSEMAKEVETASRQQDAGINQVNKAIVQFDEVVQANASSAEETASSAEELLAQVETLNSIVNNLVLLVTGKEKIIEQVRRNQTEYTTKNKSLTSTIEKKQLTHPNLKKKEIDPEKIIPFEEDEEFKQVH
jgi:methyl-accepting chemotaxis protein